MIGVLTIEQHAELLAAVRIADVAALEAIECEGLVAGGSGGNPWIDVGPMLDEREVSPRWLDLNRTMLDYALQRGLIERHPRRKHVVRVARRP